jgi:hypothetical protein
MEIWPIMAAMVMIIMVFEVQLLGWCELAHCHRENLATLGHPLWVPQGRGDWVDSIVAINCEAVCDERLEALGEVVKI